MQSYHPYARIWALEISPVPPSSDSQESDPSADHRNVSGLGTAIDLEGNRDQQAENEKEKKEGVVQVDQVGPEKKKSISLAAAVSLNARRSLSRARQRLTARRTTQSPGSDKELLPDLSDERVQALWREALMAHPRWADRRAHSADRPGEDSDERACERWLELLVKTARQLYTPCTRRVRATDKEGVLLTCLEHLIAVHHRATRHNLV